MKHRTLVHLPRRSWRTGTATFEGTFTYIGGTGRYAGVKGNGVYTGKRMAPVTPAGGADAFLDYTATYTLPSD